jgi:hypothetical protein
MGCQFRAPATLTPGEKTTGIQSLGDCVGATVSLDSLEKNKKDPAWPGKRTLASGPKKSETYTF